VWCCPWRPPSSGVPSQCRRSGRMAQHERQPIALCGGANRYAVRRCPALSVASDPRAPTPAPVATTRPPEGAAPSRWDARTSLGAARPRRAASPAASRDAGRARGTGASPGRTPRTGRWGRASSSQMGGVMVPPLGGVAPLRPVVLRRARRCGQLECQRFSGGDSPTAATLPPHSRLRSRRDDGYRDSCRGQSHQQRSARRPRVRAPERWGPQEVLAWASTARARVAAASLSRAT
jgi:hypothetical protein